jgi:hypothetical protein
MDTSNDKEKSNKQEDDAGRKKVKEEDAGIMKWKPLGLDQITKFIYRLDGTLGKRNI